MPALQNLQIHASAVGLAQRACLITGASGAGKSKLAAELIALGAGLVSDDRTDVTLRDGAVILSAPEAIRGLIEIRGTGLLRVTPSPPTPLAFLIDLDRGSEARLPRLENRELLGAEFPVIFGRDESGLAATAVLLLRGAELLDPDETPR